jgi:hypothetical protein
MEKKQVVKINLPGGVSSAGDFYEMLIMFTQTSPVHT